MCRFIVECVVIVVRHRRRAWLCAGGRACSRAAAHKHSSWRRSIYTLSPPPGESARQLLPLLPSQSHRVIPLIVAQAECCAALFRKKLRRKHCTRHADEAVAEPVLKPGPAPVQIPHWWDTVTLFFFSAHSSYRLDKINSDMRNYITNFAADLR